MPWTRERKTLFITYLETKSFKTVQAKFCWKFNSNNYPQKSQIYSWIYKFQATGSVNNLNKAAENPRSGRKLTARCPDYVNAERFCWKESEKVPLKTFSRTWSFMCIVAKNLKKGYLAVPIQNPDQA